MQFNQLWNECQHNHVLMIKHANGVMSAARHFRRAAYRFTVALIEIRTKHHNEFLDMVMSTGMDITAWMEEHFSVIEQMGEDRNRLMAVIEAGCTEKQYVEHGTVWLVRKSAKAPNKPIESSATPSPPPEPATIEERLEHLRDMVETLKSQNQGLRRRVRDAESNIARVLSENNQLTRALKKAVRAIGPVLKNR